MGWATGPNGTSQSQGAHPTSRTPLGLRTHPSTLEDVPPPRSLRAHLPPAPSWLLIGTSFLLPPVFLNAHNSTFPTGSDTQAPSQIPFQIFHHFSFSDPPLLSREASLYSGPEAGGRISRVWGHLTGSLWVLQEGLDAKGPVQCLTQKLQQASALCPIPQTT